ncbi:hypothetical protein FB567DRAFT_584748 [Paraphoma chrysanthemicola]|uniref:Uncharacterized protein n=1 Tax=Paraphoma chrysanthemicola TaxID=798071 RepID=A0A8K0QTR5_9PLEO|nr:hypothetical protein FB567DRAFT_584748 [Paraphoma chrysanthemicola]
MRTSKAAPASIYQIVDELDDQSGTVVKRYERVNIGIDIGSQDEPAERITVKKRSAIRDALKGPEYQLTKNKSLQKHTRTAASSARSPKHSEEKRAHGHRTRKQSIKIRNRSNDFRVDRDTSRSHDLIGVSDGRHSQRFHPPSVHPQPFTPRHATSPPLPPPTRNSGRHTPKLVKPEIEETQKVKQETMSDSPANRGRAITPFQQPTMNTQQSHQLVFGADTRATSGRGQNTQWDGMRRQNFGGGSRSGDELGDL